MSKQKVDADLLMGVMRGMTPERNIQQQLEDSTQRLQGILERITVCETRNASDGIQTQDEIKSKNPGSVTHNALPLSDRPSLTLDNTTTESGREDIREWSWTNAYQKWEMYEDVDDLRISLQTEQQRQQQLLQETQTVATHLHDHKDERAFFQLPESTKFAQCERYRVVGNGLYKEGLIPKAAHNYKLALAYYEYCFPTHEKDQLQLDNLRYAVLCNLALCYLRLGELRLAKETTQRVLNRKPTYSKALLWRARASRLLDEYPAAQNDLTLALETCEQPDIRQAIVQEQNALHAQIIGSKCFDQLMKERLGQTNVDKHLNKNTEDCTVVMPVDSLHKIVPITPLQGKLAFLTNMELPLEPILPSQLNNIFI